MSKLFGTKTYENLKIAFAGESQACLKYQYPSWKAKKEGFNAVSTFLDEASKNEKEHAKIWFKLINDDIKITKENLLEAIKSEEYEYNEMYKNFAEVAEQEGFNDIASLFRMIGKIEEHHASKFQQLINSIDSGSIFSSNDNAIWICTNCGHIHVGKNAPELCPVCKHPKGYFIREKSVI